MVGYTSTRVTHGIPDSGAEPSSTQPSVTALRSAGGRTPLRATTGQRLHRAAAVGAVLALALPLAACSSNADSGGAGRPVAVSTPSASPTPTVDPDRYRRALTAALGPLNNALRTVDGAQDGKPLNTALDTAAAKADAAADSLDTAEIPDDAITGNGQLAASLRALGQDLRSARGDGSRCATSPRVELGSAESPENAEEAGRALTALGYDARLRPPRTEEPRHRRLANGSFVRDGSRGGLGRLTVKNGTSSDAVVTLTRSGRTAFSVYVRKSSEATVRSVNSGSYTVYFTTGEDWNGGKRSFTRECSFEKFDDQANFRTIRVAGGTQYTVLTFSLNKVVGGNASTSQVPPGDFPS